MWILKKKVCTCWTVSLPRRLTASASSSFPIAAASVAPKLLRTLGVDIDKTPRPALYKFQRHASDINSSTAYQSWCIIRSHVHIYVFTSDINCNSLRTRSTVHKAQANVTNKVGSFRKAFAMLSRMYENDIIFIHLPETKAAFVSAKKKGLRNQTSPTNWKKKWINPYRAHRRSRLIIRSKGLIKKTKENVSVRWRTDECAPVHVSLQSRRITSLLYFNNEGGILPRGFVSLIEACMQSASLGQKFLLVVVVLVVVRSTRMYTKVVKRETALAASIGGPIAS